MPQEVVITLREHHNPRYEGDYAMYVHLMLMVDHLLKREAIGDAPDGTIPEKSLAIVGIPEERATTALNDLMENTASLESMARQLATV